MTKFLSLLIVTTIVFSCKSKEEIVENNIEMNCKQMVIGQYTYNKDKMLAVDSIFVNDNCLGVIIPMACDNFDYDLKWNEMLMKSMPPKASFYIEEPQNDNCNNLSSRTLYWDLSPLKNQSKVYIRVNDSKSFLIDFEASKP